MLQGEESVGEGTDNHEIWKSCHYYETSRGGKSAEINREIIAGHGINTDRKGFAYCSACPFLAPFSSVFHTPELGRRPKSNKLINLQYVFFVDSLIHLQALLRVARKIPLWT